MRKSPVLSLAPELQLAVTAVPASTAIPTTLFTLSCQACTRYHTPVESVADHTAVCDPTPALRTLKLSSLLVLVYRPYSQVFPSPTSVPLAQITQVPPDMLSTLIQQRTMKSTSPVDRSVLSVMLRYSLFPASKSAASPNMPVAARTVLLSVRSLAPTWSARVPLASSRVQAATANGAASARAMS